MAEVRMRNLVDGAEPVEFHIEGANPEDANKGAKGLLVFTHGPADSRGEFATETNVIFETDADSIREFRDMVVEECNKALRLLGANFLRGV